MIKNLVTFIINAIIWMKCYWSTEITLDNTWVKKTASKFQKRLLRNFIFWILNFKFLNNSITFINFRMKSNWISKLDSNSARNFVSFAKLASRINELQLFQSHNGISNLRNHNFRPWLKNFLTIDKKKTKIWETGFQIIWLEFKT